MEMIRRRVVVMKIEKDNEEGRAENYPVDDGADDR